MLETELNKTKKQLSNKKIIMLFIIMTVATVSAFCDSNTPTNLSGVTTVKDVFATVYAFFTSAAVRIIAIAGVIFTGIKMITNKGNPEMMKTLIPIFIACMIIGSASWFVGKFMGGDIKQATEIGGTSWW